MSGSSNTQANKMVSLDRPIEGGGFEVVVERANNFCRLNPHIFSMWKSEIAGDIFYELLLERSETHDKFQDILLDPPRISTKKFLTTKVQIASVELTLTQMKSLANLLNNVIRSAEEKSDEGAADPEE